jgi:hypothetical protein
MYKMGTFDKDYGATDYWRTLQVLGEDTDT